MVFSVSIHYLWGFAGATNIIHYFSFGENTFIAAYAQLIEIYAHMQYLAIEEIRMNFKEQLTFNQ